MSDWTALHSYPIPSDHWWACDQPERPHDASRTWIDEGCRSCVLALGAAAHVDPDGLLTDYITGAGYRMADAYEELRQNFELPALAR